MSDGGDVDCVLTVPMLLGALRDLEMMEYAVPLLVVLAREGGHMVAAGLTHACEEVQTEELDELSEAADVERQALAQLNSPCKPGEELNGIAEQRDDGSAQEAESNASVVSQQQPLNFENFCSIYIACFLRDTSHFKKEVEDAFKHFDTDASGTLESARAATCHRHRLRCRCRCRCRRRRRRCRCRRPQVRAQSAVARILRCLINGRSAQKRALRALADRARVVRVAP
jgi:hypothetical protein